LRQRKLRDPLLADIEQAFGIEEDGLVVGTYPDIGRDLPALA
jgi:hypothetical protein